MLSRTIGDGGASVHSSRAPHRTSDTDSDGTCSVQITFPLFGVSPAKVDPNLSPPFQADDKTKDSGAAETKPTKRAPRKPKKDRPKPTAPKDKALEVDGGVKKKRVKKDKKKKDKKHGKKDSGDATAVAPTTATATDDKKPGGGAPPTSSKWKHGDWSCQKCGAHNFRGKDSCFRCKYARANSVKAASAESALAYLTKRGSGGGGASEMDDVQHLWLGKAAYTKDVNDSIFDLYVDKYVPSLEDKHKLQILKRARLAKGRAERLVQALENTPETEKPKAKNPNKKRGKKKKAGKEDGDGGEKAQAPGAGSGEAKETPGKKKDDTKQEETTKVLTLKKEKAFKIPSKKSENTTETSEKPSDSKNEKETPGKRKAEETAPASPARVTRSRAAKK